VLLRFCGLCWLSALAVCCLLLISLYACLCCAGLRLQSSRCGRAFCWWLFFLVLRRLVWAGERLLE
jgi:hypothetical protein